MNGGKYGTTKDYPDDAIRFARTHPLMYQPIKPAHKKPILVKTDGKYNLKQLAVDRVEAEDGQYDVLFIGTGKDTRKHRYISPHPQISFTNQHIPCCSLFSHFITKDKMTKGIYSFNYCHNIKSYLWEECCKLLSTQPYEEQILCDTSA